MLSIIITKLRPESFRPKKAQAGTTERQPDIASCVNLNFCEDGHYVRVPKKELSRLHRTLQLRSRRACFQGSMGISAWSFAGADLVFRKLWFGQKIVLPDF